MQWSPGWLSGKRRYISIYSYIYLLYLSDLHIYLFHIRYSIYCLSIYLHISYILSNCLCLLLFIPIYKSYPIINKFYPPTSYISYSLSMFFLSFISYNISATPNCLQKMKRSLCLNMQNPHSRDPPSFMTFLVL